MSKPRTKPATKIAIKIEITLHLAQKFFCPALDEFGMCFISDIPFTFALFCLANYLYF
jgi:hypothetical protein